MSRTLLFAVQMPVDVRKGRLRRLRAGAAQRAVPPRPPACPSRLASLFSCLRFCHWAFALAFLSGGGGLPFLGISFSSLPSLPLVCSHLSEVGGPSPVTPPHPYLLFVKLPPLPRFALRVCVCVCCPRREGRLFTWPPPCHSRGTRAVASHTCARVRWMCVQVSPQLSTFLTLGCVTF